MNGLVILAFGTGLLAPLNPCGFALLPGFFALAATRPGEGPTPSASSRLLRGLSAGLLVTIGFTGALIVFGLLITFGLRGVVQAAPWIGVGLGVVLAGVGLAMVFGWRMPAFLPTIATPRADSRGASRLIMFGVGYALASLSCTFGILLALIGQALAADSSATIGAVFLAYALGAATILLLLGATTGAANALLAQRLRGVSHWAPRIVGAFLIAAGIYMIVYWLPVITGSDTRNPVVTATTQIAADIATWVSSHQTSIVTTTAIALTAIVLAAAMTRHRRASKPPDCCHVPTDPHGPTSGDHAASYPKD